MWQFDAMMWTAARSRHAKAVSVGYYNSPTSPRHSYSREISPNGFWGIFLRAKLLNSRVCLSVRLSLSLSGWM